LSFGVFFFDYDLDGRQDIVVANGHLEEDINKVQASQFYEQPPQLFWNSGPESPTEFVHVPESNSGKDFTKRMVGRGAAYADIDGDGDLDVLLTAVGQAPRLLRNDQKLDHHWLRVKLTGKKSNRDAIGAIVEADVAGRKLWQQVMPTRSYLSQVELPVTLGLGTDKQIDKLTIRWPDGETQEIAKPEIDKTLAVEQK
jgi:hypothetical protein